MITPKTYSIAEAAQIFGVKKGLIYKLVNAQRIPSLKIGYKRIVIPKIVVDQIIEDASQGKVFSLDFDPITKKKQKN